MDTVTITKWSDLLEELYRDAWDPAIRRFRSSFVFRGICRRDGGLVHGLSRLANGHDEIARLERHLLRNFRKYAYAEFATAGSDWRWLPFAQHHGLPTRLLDWTFSPLVALHFATDNPTTYDSDGAVWCIQHQHSNDFLPEPLKQIAAREGADVFTAEMLESVAGDLGALEALANEPFLLFLEPPSFDPRIANQFALFSMMSRADANLPDWLEPHEGTAREIIIPAGAKQEIRDKLDQAGITERMIYPGADGIARWLTRYYRPL